MLAAHVDEEPGRRPEEAPVAQGPVRVALEHALVGDDRAHVDVDPDERGAHRRRHRERRLGVVLEHVDPDRQAHGAAHLGGGDRRGRDGRRIGAPRAERRVPEVLHEAGVEAAGLERARVGHRALDHRVQGPAPAGAAGQREEVDHPDQRRAGGRGSPRGSRRPPRARRPGAAAPSPLHLGAEQLHPAGHERERLAPRGGLAVGEARPATRWSCLSTNRPRSAASARSFSRARPTSCAASGRAPARAERQLEVREAQAVGGRVGGAELRVREAPEERVEMAPPPPRPAPRTPDSARGGVATRCPPRATRPPAPASRVAGPAWPRRAPPRRATGTPARRGPGR